MTVKICASIIPKTVEEALNSVEKAKNHGADFIEVRLDILKEYNKLADITECSNVPMVAANRSMKDHGHFLGSETERQQTLLKAAESGFEYIDVDLSSPNRQNIINKVDKTGAKPIVSFHDFTRTLSLARMNKILEEEIESKADICKIVTTATQIEDNLTMLNFVSGGRKKAKIVSFAMGELGKPSRILSPLFGAHFTIASLEKKRETAPGQMTIKEMQRIYRNMGLVQV
jgi:3-dehydroquinate dehydratase type I